MNCTHRESARNEYGVCVDCVKEGVGIKADGGKVNMAFLFDFWDALREIVRVLEHGAKKYDRGNYVNVPNARERYSRALLDHVADWYNGNTLDTGPKGSGLHHLAHAGCCLLFLLAMDLRGLLEKSPKK